MSKYSIQDTISSNGINILFSSINMQFFIFTDFERRSGKDRFPDIDGIIKLKDEEDELLLHYQIKSHQKIPNIKKYRIPKKDINYLTKTNVPTLFFMVDIANKNSYWYFLNKNINPPKSITVDISTNIIKYEKTEDLYLKWKTIAKPNKYSEAKKNIVRISEKFELNVQTSLGVLYLFGAIKKQEFHKIISDLLNIKEYESKTIIKHLESADIISSTINYYLLENEKLGIESLFLLLDSQLLDFENLDKHLNIDNKKIVFNQLNKINHPKVEKYFNKLSKDFKDYLLKFRNNDDVFVNLELLESYIYRVPNTAIQILKEIINSKNPLKVITRNIKGWGKVKGKSHNDLVKKSIELLEKLRYVKPKDVFILLLKLSNSENEDIKEKAVKALKNMAEYNLFVLQKIGYQPQIFLLDKIEKFGDRKLLTLFDAISGILEQIINPSFEGNEMTDYKTFTIRSGGLNANKNLQKIRERAIEVLKKLFLLSKTTSQRKKVLRILSNATQTPFDNYTEELEKLILDNTNKIIKFYIEVVKNADHEIINEIEEQSHWFIKRYSNKLKNIKKLQSLIAQNSEYNMFKIFVGYDYHFEEDLNWREAEKERKRKIQEFVSQISDDNFNEWHSKILSVVDNYNQVKDYGRYQYFNIFLNELGKQKPDIAQKLIQNNEAQLDEFLIHLVAGIYLSTKKDLAVKFIEDFIKSGRQLTLCTYIFSYVKEIDEKLLRKAFQKAKQKKDIHALNNVIRSIVDNYPKDKKHKKLFIQTIKELTKLKNYWWINNVRYQKESIIESLSEKDFDIILNNLLLVPNIDYHAEVILDIIAKNYPLKIVQFFERRISIQSKKKGEDRYDAVPYNFHKLKLILQKHGKVVIPVVLKWFKKKNWLFRWDGGHFLKNIYSINKLDSELVKLLNAGIESDIEIVLSILNTYQGHITLDSKAVQTIIRKYPKHHNRLIYSMSATGNVVFGEYGLVNSLKSKKNTLQKWKKDRRKYIQDFIKKYEKSLDKQINYEKKRADEDLELRKHKYK